jgi:choline dehydrogenase
MTKTIIAIQDLVLQRQHNLHIATNIIVDRGVHLVTRTGSSNKQRKTTTVQTRKEIILCAGPFGSHVLMLSGIGPADHLKKHNINISHCWI